VLLKLTLIINPQHPAPSTSPTISQHSSTHTRTMHHTSAAHTMLTHTATIFLTSALLQPTTDRHHPQIFSQTVNNSTPMISPMPILTAPFLP
jgi:hypothetical protein